MTAISVSERLLEMAAFYTWLDFTLTILRLLRLHFIAYIMPVFHNNTRSSAAYAAPLLADAMGPDSLC